ncbi:MAG TPA: glucokinase [Polyangia bacterium]
MIIAGDIGGTKTVLALFEQNGEDLRLVREDTFLSHEYHSFEAVIEEFLGRGPRPTLAGGCFGVAGPVAEGKARLTNLPWILDEEKLAQALPAPRVRLLNDLEAAAFGMLFLAPEEFEVLQAGKSDAKGDIAVIAPGTGLGEALLHFDGQKFHAIPSEGGHTDFAPRTDDEIVLLRHLRTALAGHISYERILSGAGIGNLYRCLRTEATTREPDWLVEDLQRGDPNAAISAAALAKRDPVCVQALKMFCAVLGAEAGNLALKGLTTGGVIIGGGIAPKILPALKEGAFLAALADKGRFSGWAKTLPVRVALNPRAPLIGASRFLVSSAIHPGARG